MWSYFMIVAWLKCQFTEPGWGRQNQEIEDTAQCDLKVRPGTGGSEWNTPLRLPKRSVSKSLENKSLHHVPRSLHHACERNLGLPIISCLHKNEIPAALKHYWIARWEGNREGDLHACSQQLTTSIPLSLTLLNLLPVSDPLHHK